MIKWAQELFPICRSIAGKGQKETLEYLKKINKDLKIVKIKSGKKFFDWITPKEWDIEDAYLEHESGRKFAEFKKNNLHVVNYSDSIDKIINFQDLKNKIFTLPTQKNAIPYVTSYYSNSWGFCMSHKDFIKLPKGKYRAYINASKNIGYLRYGELTRKGISKKIIIFSTYICHPSMANNELSGPVVNSALIEFIKKILKIITTHTNLFLFQKQ